MSYLTKYSRRLIKNPDDKKLFFNIIGNYFVKGGAMLVSFLVMPAYMHYFKSNSILGMWFTVVQLLNWIMLLDFGIGGGLRNKIIGPLKQGNRERVLSLISSAYFSVLGIVGLLIFLQFELVDFVNWYSMLGILPEDIPLNILRHVVHILIIGVIIRFFNVLISHILYALQKAILPSLLNFISNCLIMIYLVLVEPSGDDFDIIKLAYINVIANNLPAFIATIWVFSTILKGMWPRLSAFRWSVAKEVLSTGGVLFYLQIVIMLLFNVKEIYISWFVGAKEVVEYQIYYKLIGVFGGLYSLALTPVWSAVTKAIVEKKAQWVKQLYKRGLGMIALFGLGQMVMLLFMPWIIKIWLGSHAIPVSQLSGILFCGYNLIYMWMMLNYNFACGMGKTRVITVWITLASILNYLLTLWGSSFYSSWIMVIVATAIATIPCAILVQKDIFSVIKNMYT